MIKVAPVSNNEIMEISLRSGSNYFSAQNIRLHRTKLNALAFKVTIDDIGDETGEYFCIESGKGMLRSDSSISVNILQMTVEWQKRELDGRDILHSYVRIISKLGEFGNVTQAKRCLKDYLNDLSNGKKPNVTWMR